MREHILSPGTDRVLGLFLALSLVIPLSIGILWGEVYDDTAYRQFQQARAVFRGADATWEGLSFSPAASSSLYLELLALLIRLPWPLPTVALSLSVLGWMVCILAWFYVGLALDRPLFAVLASFLLALHPLQSQVLGLESGLLLGLFGLTALWAVRGQSAVMLISMLVLVAVQPAMLAFAAPLFVFSQVWRRSSPTLTQMAASVAVGLVGYAVACVLDGASRGAMFDELGPQALLLAAAQLVAAAGYVLSAPNLDWLVQPIADKRALQRGIAALCVLVLLLWQGNSLLVHWRMRPADRLASYKTVAQWLRTRALPLETIAASETGALGYYSDRGTVALPDKAQTSAILAAIEQARPDYCVALDSLPWHGVRSQTWFQERYQQLHQFAVPYDSATPLTIFGYTPSPFDRGEIRGRAARFTPDLDEWIELRGYRLDSQRIMPGEPLHLTLYWRAATMLHQSMFLTLRLVDPATEKVWTQIQNLTPGGLATDLWNAETQLADHLTLFPPVDLPPGDYALNVALYPWNDDNVPILSGIQGEALQRAPLPLARVYYPPSVSATPLTPDHSLSFTFGDEIALIGYDAPERVGPGGEVRVALYWHALRAVSYEYKVFVHLFGPDDQLLAQDDNLPVNWTYPTTRWQPGEYVRDEHILTIDPNTPRGDYALSVGLYDSATGERAVVRDAAGNEIAERRVELRRIQVR